MRSLACRRENRGRLAGRQDIESRARRDFKGGSVRGGFLLFCQLWVRFLVHLFSPFLSVRAWGSFSLLKKSLFVLHDIPVAVSKTIIFYISRWHTQSFGKRKKEKLEGIAAKFSMVKYS